MKSTRQASRSAITPHVAPTLDRPAPIRYTYRTMTTLTELQAVYDLPLPELIFRAAEVHRAYHDCTDIQRSLF